MTSHTPRWVYAAVCGLNVGVLNTSTSTTPTWMTMLATYGAVVTGLLALAPRDE